MNTKVRPVTEDGTHEPHTGWYCYYVYGKGGIGYYDAHYIYEPELTLTGTELAEHFVNEYEYEFFSWAGAPVLEVFSNVTPPKAAIEKMIAREKYIISNAQENITRYEKFLN